jgi:hypothetical protein
MPGTDQRRWRKPVPYGLERVLDILSVDQHVSVVLHYSRHSLWQAQFVASIDVENSPHTSLLISRLYKSSRRVRTGARNSPRRAQ